MLLALGVLCKILGAIIGLAVFLGVLEDLFAPNGWPHGKLSGIVLLEVIAGTFIMYTSWKSTVFAVGVLLLTIVVVVLWRQKNRQKTVSISRK